MDTGPGPIDRRPSGPSGVRIFLYVLLGLGVLLVGTCSIAVYRVSQDEEFRSLVQSAVESQSGPAHDALVAEGCTVALALDLTHAAALVEKWGGESADIQQLAGELVQCETAAGNPNGIDCGRIATLYASLAGPTDKFLVIVSATGADEAICSVLADPDGNVLGSLEEMLKEDPSI